MIINKCQCDKCGAEFQRKGIMIYTRDKFHIETPQGNTGFMSRLDFCTVQCLVDYIENIGKEKKGEASNGGTT